MIPSAPTIAARIEARGIARLEAISTAVCETDLHDVIADCHLDPEIRGVVMTHGLIARLIDTPQPSQKGNYR